MKVAYPHMGYLNIPIYNMLSNLGIEVIETPPITKKTLEIGSLHSPEGVCLPYKINMGNFLESIEKGADTLLTVCGAGKCRLGFYNNVQKLALAKYNVKLYSINISDNFLSNLYRLLKQLAPTTSSLAIIKNISHAIKTLRSLDNINMAKNYYGARTNNPDTIINIYNTGITKLSHCNTFSDINTICQNITAAMQAATTKQKQSPLKIGLIGEFYLLLEPYANHQIEDLLLKQGIEVKKFIYTGDWTYSNTILSLLKLHNEETNYLNKARPYLNHHIGGDGLKTVGSALWCAKNDFDGIIHIYPFSCMPEIVAQYPLKNIVNDYDFPILSLSIDEHASDVGIITRLEAFVDCLKRRAKNS